MYISTSKGKQNFKPKEVKKFEQLSKIILSTNYSFGTFKDNDRTKTSFVSASALGLDFDNGMSLETALSEFKEYKHIISLSRNHQKVKNPGLPAEKPACDRFRVMLFLEEVVTVDADFKATVASLMDKYPDADKSCKDSTRFFYPSTKIVQSSMNGKLIKPVKYVKPKKKEIVTTSGIKGDLLPTTLKFLVCGVPQGGGNPSLFQAAKDCQAQTYSKEEFLVMFDQMVANPSAVWNRDAEKEVKYLETIDNAFKEVPKDEPRIEPCPFNFKPIGELYKNNVVLNWSVHKLFQTGGMSIIVGPPKSGKSTLVRQLAKSVARGERFLDRTCKPGKVAYMALEEHEGLLKDQMKKSGIDDKDQILLHVGHLRAGNVITSLMSYLRAENPSLLIIDTLSLLGKFDDLNNYESVNKTMHSIKELARDTETHVVLIHHSNKSESTRGNSIMGSQAIFGSVDCAMFFTQHGAKRFISTSGRGTINFNDREIIFDEETETYSLGAEQSKEF